MLWALSKRRSPVINDVRYGDDVVVSVYASTLDWMVCQ